MCSLVQHFRPALALGRKHATQLCWFCYQVPTHMLRPTCQHGCGTKEDRSPSFSGTFPGAPNGAYLYCAQGRSPCVHKAHMTAPKQSNIERFAPQNNQNVGRFAPKTIIFWRPAPQTIKNRLARPALANMTDHVCNAPTAALVAHALGLHPLHPLGVDPL